MQVMIGNTSATVSDDGRDIQFPAPAVAGRVLALPFHDTSRASKPALATSTVASTIKADMPVLKANLDGSAGAVLVCAVVAAVAVIRFIGRDKSAGGEVAIPPYAELDDAAFLKRYARSQ